MLNYACVYKFLQWGSVSLSKNVSIYNFTERGVEYARIFTKDR